MIVYKDCKHSSETMSEITWSLESSMDRPWVVCMKVLKICL